MKKQILFLSLFLLVCGAKRALAQDSLLSILKSELQQQMKELKGEKCPPYHMNYRVVDKRTTYIETSFGVVSRRSKGHQRIFVPQVRIGDPSFDNFESQDMGSERRQSGFAYASLPIEDVNAGNAIRQAIWNETSNRYKFAVSAYENAEINTKVKIAEEDKAPCFTASTVEKYYEEPLPGECLSVDAQAWEKRLEEISSVFREYPYLLLGNAMLSYTVERRYFVDTDGTEVVQNLPYARMAVTAITKAEDGMELPLYLSYFAYDPKNLPGNDQIIAEVRALAKKLGEMREAPVVEPYAGPALLTGEASGVFFHEIFGHRVEGQRMRHDGDGQTFKKMVGKYVLPEGMSVYDDPNMKEFQGIELNGYYKFDDQGVKAERVDVVVDGKMNDFLMTRTPIDNHPRSNGHARAEGGADPISRQSNLVIETKHHKTDVELRTLFVEELKKQEKDFGYFFKQVTGGFTFTGKGQINSFNVTPLEVYKVFADGRPDQLVRGVDLVGTPLAMFSNIAYAGGRSGVFTGMCGAESGQIPVTAISPMILVNKVEVQRKAKSQNTLPILDRPDQRKKK